MAKIMQYADERGNDYPQSYWRTGIVEVNLISNSIRIVFVGYGTSTARDEGKQAIGIKEYFIGDQTIFQQWFDVIRNPSPDTNIVQQIYMYVSQAIEPDTGKSFFDGATDDM